MQANQDTGSSGLHSEHTQDDLNSMLGIIDTYSSCYYIACACNAICLWFLSI